MGHLVLLLRRLLHRAAHKAPMVEEIALARALLWRERGNMLPLSRDECVTSECGIVVMNVCLGSLPAMTLAKSGFEASASRLLLQGVMKHVVVDVHSWVTSFAWVMFCANPAAHLYSSHLVYDMKLKIVLSGSMRIGIGVVNEGNEVSSSARTTLIWLCSSCKFSPRSNV